LVGQDGATHHGFFDLAFLSSVPGLKILAPQSSTDLKKCMEEASKSETPVVIRFPRGNCENEMKPIVTIQSPQKIIVTVGTIGRRIQKIINENKLQSVLHIPLMRIKPIDPKVVEKLQEHNKSDIYVFEDGMESGGVGQRLAALFPERRVFIKGYPDRFIEQGLVSDLEQEISFDSKSLLQTLVQ
jgi:1-deoxy-D-xylulose-5-phosphate synthase